MALEAEVINEERAKLKDYSTRLEELRRHL
jgi:hypothetical protein